RKPHPRLRAPALSGVLRRTLVLWTCALGSRLRGDDVLGEGCHCKLASLPRIRGCRSSCSTATFSASCPRRRAPTPGDRGDAGASRALAWIPALAGMTCWVSDVIANPRHCRGCAAADHLAAPRHSRRHARAGGHPRQVIVVTPVPRGRLRGSPPRE